MQRQLASLKDISNLVALPHTIFALPFAVSALMLAARKSDLSLSSPVFARTLLLVVFAVAFARASALAFNRLVDIQFDRLNPRTENRELVKGRLSPFFAKVFIVVNSICFLACAALLGMHCFVLAPLVLLVLLAYSYMKRFTSLSHLVLGFALALAPGGAWWVLRPQFELLPLVLMLAVLFWVAGFDMLYSCQDVSFDRKHKLFSLPARLGIGRTLFIARVFHALTFLMFLMVGYLAGLDWLYLLGLFVLSVPLASQHMLISEDDLSRVNTAFFTLNGFVSLGYFLVILLVA